eukprot:gene1820-4919_t
MAHNTSGMVVTNPVNCLLKEGKLNEDVKNSTTRSRERHNTSVASCIRIISSGADEKSGSKQLARSGHSREAHGMCTTLFMLHDSTGVVDHFRNMASVLKCECFGIQLVDDAPLSSLDDLSKYYADEIHQFKPEGRLFIGGFSLGVKLAALVANTLQEIGRDIAGIVCVEDSIIVDSGYADSSDRSGVMEGMLNLFLKPSAKPSRHQLASALIGNASRESLGETVLSIPEEHFSEIMKPFASKKHTSTAKQLAESMASIAAALVQVTFITHRMKHVKLNCNALLIRSTSEKRMTFAHRAGLRDILEAGKIEGDYGIHRNVTGRIDVIILDVDHHDMFQPTHAKAIAKYINEFMQNC